MARVNVACNCTTRSLRKVWDCEWAFMTRSKLRPVTWSTASKLRAVASAVRFSPRWNGYRMDDALRHHQFFYWFEWFVDNSHRATNRSLEYLVVADTQLPI